MVVKCKSIKGANTKGKNGILEKSLNLKRVGAKK